MVWETKSECQADLATIMGLYFTTSIADEEEGEEEEEEEIESGGGENMFDEDGDFELFEILDLQTMWDILRMSGDRSRGSYGNQSRSSDWLSATLSAPDCDFRRTFRYAKL
jgi:hypothetical protein